MKSYLIWLKNGECIKGEMEDGEANILLTLFEKECNKRKRINDNTGVACIDFKEVAAIAVNDVINNNPLGY